MKTLNLVQGTPDWHAHRAQHFNASDAPAMLGISPYKTRAELLREYATGVRAEVDAATQRRFDDGHRFEELARPIAEQIIGEELYPCSGVLENTKLSASFDGLTLLEDTGFEHKTLNNSLRELVWLEDASHLPEMYCAQMEHQMLVSGADRVLFMASQWDGETLIEERHCWYASDKDLRARIIAGWKQFERDLADYVPEPAKVEPVATPVEGFGTLSLRVEGRVLASNLDAFKAGAESFIARLPKASELETDQDFADAEAAVKACTEAESRIKSAIDAALAQMSDVDAVMRAAGTVSETIRAARLALDRVVKAEKENRRAAIVSAGVKSVLDHYASINATLGEYSIGAPASLSSELGAAIKGKRTISSITDAVDAAVAQAKIEASQRADAIRVNVAILQEHADWLHIIPGPVQLVHTKQPDDLRNLLSTRVAEYKRQLDQDAKEELAKQEAERIRAEEQAKAERAAQNFEGITNDAGSIPASRPISQQQQDADSLANPAEVAASPRSSPSGTIKLGQINDAIGPLSITAAGLAQLGFEPVGKERAAVLYDDADFDLIVAALIARLESARVENRRAA